ncbi:MAG: NADH-quinone oxidoreductase subunit J [Thermoleophilia bacterium]
MAEQVLFVVFGALAVAGALGVVTRSNIVHGLILLVFSFVNVAAIYLLTNAYFLAVIQILVYAGAILVLFTFVVMFLNLQRFQQLEQLHAKQKWAVLILAPIVLAEFVVVALAATWTSVSGGMTPEAIAAAGGNVLVLGETFFADALLPFEIAGVILLVGMIGAVALARKEFDTSMALRDWSAEEEEPVRELVEQEV